MGHPKNRGERLYRQKKKVSRYKKLARQGALKYSATIYPQYARDRGDYQIIYNFYDPNERYHFSHFSGPYEDEPVFLVQNGRGNMRKFYKAYANKRTRRNKNEFQKGTAYKKDFDLWWILY